MKNLFKVASFALIGLFVFTSCKKEPNALKLESFIDIDGASRAQVANLSNQFDYEGEFYVSFMNMVSKDKGKDTTTPRKKDLGNWDVSKLPLSTDGNGNGTGKGNAGWDVSKIANYMDDIGDWDVSKTLSMAESFANQANNLRLPLDFDLAEIINSSMGLYIESLMNMEFSEDEDCWMHPNLCNTEENPVDLMDPSGNGTSYDRTLNYLKEIKRIENRIIADTTMNADSKKNALIRYSIARYSAAYWHNDLYGGREVKTDTENRVGYMVALTTLGSSNAIEISGRSDAAGIAAGIFVSALLDN